MSIRFAVTMTAKELIRAIQEKSPLRHKASNGWLFVPERIDEFDVWGMNHYYAGDPQERNWPLTMIRDFRLATPLEIAGCLSLNPEQLSNL